VLNAAGTLVLEKGLRRVTGGVTAAEGFRASGVSAGIKRSRKPDLSLVVADAPCASAAVFTRNQVKAAPLLISRDRLAKGRAQAVLLNSGCANCMTGKPGLADAKRLAREASRLLGVSESMVLVASTGIIGRRLPVGRMLRAMPKLAKLAKRANHTAAAQAILTTDLLPKEAAVEARVNGLRCRLGGMAKGSGMIAPSMATMLCVITSDVDIEPAFLRELLQGASERTFNRISVDGDMSTNDTVYALASGASGIKVRRGTRAAKIFAKMLEAVCEQLAYLIVKDGEGAARLMRVDVVGARNDQEALACARQVAYSPLVKTMLAGGDPNVGRIAGAVGASPAMVDPDRMEIFLGSHCAVRNGEATRLNKSLMRQLLSHSFVSVRVDLHQGRGSGWMTTCDLTEKYVRINAGYAT